MTSNARIGIQTDTKDAEKGITTLRGKFSGLSKDLKGGLLQGFAAGAGIAAFTGVQDAVAGVVKGLTDSVEQASQLEQSAGAVESVFGKSAGKIQQFGEGAADALGLSKRAVNELSAVLGAQLQGMGFDVDTAADKVQQLETRAADMAATFGGTTKDAVQAIASLMRGERDPIERYGVSIKAADVNARILAMGLDTSTTAAQKNAEAVAGLDLLMEQTAKTSGQFARESDSLAGKQQKNAAKIENAMAKLGGVVMPVFVGLADALSLVIDLSTKVGGAVGGVVNFLKPGLVGLAAVIAGALIPAFAGWAAGAVAAGAATIAALAPILVPLAAVTAAVVGVSLAVNHFAMDFGDMGDRIHKIADGTKHDFTEVKDWIRARMAETGESFEQAALAAERQFGAIGDTLATSSSVTGRWADAQKQAYARAYAATEEYASGFAGTIVEKMEQGRLRVIDIALRTPGDIANALREGRDAVTAAAEQLARDQEDALAPAAERANLIAQLTGDQLAAGLASKDPIVRAQAQALRQAIQDRLSQLNSYAWGSAIAKAWADGVASRWGYAHARAIYLGTSLSGPLKGYSPPREGPLQDIDKWGENIGQAWAGGLSKGANRGLSLLPGVPGVTSSGGAGAAAGAASAGGGAPAIIQLVLDGRVLAEVVDRQLYYMAPRQTVIPR